MAWTNGMELVNGSGNIAFAEHQNQQMMAARGNYVLSGLVITANASSDLSTTQVDIDISDGDCYNNATVRNLTSITSLDLSAHYSGLASGQSRYVFIYVSTSGTVTSVAGSIATTGQQLPPDIVEDTVALAMVTLTFGDTTVDAADIEDWQIENPTGQSMGDNDKSYWGNAGDLSIYHDGTNSYINNATGELNIVGNTNFSAGIDVTGVSTFTYGHDTVNPTVTIDNSSGGGTGLLLTTSLADSDWLFWANGADGTFRLMNKSTYDDTATVLKFDNSSLVGTFPFNVNFSAGIDVTGILNVTHPTTDTVAIFTSGDNSVAVDIVALDNSTQIATSGQDALFKNNGTGALRLFSNSVEGMRMTGSAITSNINHDFSAGIDVTGVATLSSTSTLTGLVTATTGINIGGGTPDTSNTQLYVTGNALIGANVQFNDTATSGFADIYVLKLRSTGHTSAQLSASDRWVSFRDSSDVEVGSITNGVVYNTFTGAHRLQTDDPYLSRWEQGMIVSSTGELIGGGDISNALVMIELSKNVSDSRVIGIFSGYEEDHNTNYLDVNKPVIEINALGEGKVLVCNINGELNNGDYITTSSVMGYGQKQDDDILHNYTVAKVTEQIDWDDIEENEDGIKKYLIACTYHCG